jgi:hypothetical protein
VAHPAVKVKNLFASMHLKLGLIKMSVKAMDKESEGFAYLRQ